MYFSLSLSLSLSLSHLHPGASRGRVWHWRLEVEDAFLQLMCGTLDAHLFNQARHVFTVALPGSPAGGGGISVSKGECREEGGE